MLEIKNLHVSTENKKILNGVSLQIKPGEVHAIMGPNGSGKSSLSLALLGHPRYRIDSGQIIVDGRDVTNLTPDKRAKAGLFLAMQYPVAVPGVSASSLIRSAYKNVKEEALPPTKLVSGLKSLLAELKLDESFASRGVNDGFSGGEKKKIEILQMRLINPKYSILDETDSGLDVDALKIVARGIKKYATDEVGVLLITHYQRILRYIEPDFVHILVDGKIVKSGDSSLAEKIEEQGYAQN